MMKRILPALLVLALMAVMAAPACAQSYAVAVNGAAVRTGPGLGYSLCAQLGKGSTVSYLQQSAYDSRGVLWYRISLNNGESGWVSSASAELTDEAGFATYASGAGVAPDAAFGFLTGEVTVTGNVNVRSGPGLGHEILGTMREGETAVYLGVTSSDERGVAWYWIQAGDVTGWVSSVYAGLSSQWTLEHTAVEGVSGDSNVRKGPGLGYASVGTLFKGETAPYLGVSSVDERGVSWYLIRFGDAGAGWVSSRYTALAN